jgi:hypothetical protein
MKLIFNKSLPTSLKHSESSLTETDRTEMFWELLESFEHINTFLEHSNLEYSIPLLFCCGEDITTKIC